MSTKIEFPRQTFRHEPAASDDRAWLVALVERIGEKDAAHEIGLSRATLARAIGGLGIHAGTRALIRVAKERLVRAA